MSKKNQPDLNNLLDADLRDDDRLRAVYVLMCKAGFWRSRDAADVLTFWALAEKALQEDKRGTPGALFYGLIKRKDFSKITNAQEDRAAARVNSAERNEIHFQVANIEPVQQRLPKIDPQEESNLLYGRNIGFNHGVMMQCFMPQKRFDGPLYKQDHGRATLAIQPGYIADPNKQNHLIPQTVPFGPRARLIMPYINGYALQHDTAVIDMGDSLRRFFERFGMTYGGKQGKDLFDQVQNIASAQFLIGQWDDEPGSTTQWRNVGKELRLWPERDPNQGLLWERELTLHDDYFATIREHQVPVDLDHLVALMASPRAQDLYSWLAYRLPKLRRPLNMPYSVLANNFGGKIKDPYKFRQVFRTDLKRVQSVYGFNVDAPHRKDYVTLCHTKSPVPAKVTPLIPGKKRSGTSGR